MLKAEVLQNNVIVIKDNAVSDSVKFETVSFNFPKSWSGFKKTAVFISKDKEAFNVVLDEGNPLCLNETECFIPHEVLKAPSFELSVFGVKDDKIATATPAYVKVLKSGFVEGGEPTEPTPDEYQQLIKLAEDTRQIAQSVRDDADNGLFGGAAGQKGEKGDPGPQGEKGEKGDKGDNGEVTYNYAHFNLSNALKGVKSGKSVSLDDVSPLEHELKVKLTSDTVTDFSGVSVIRRSKNILPFPYSGNPIVSEGATIEVSDDGKVTFSGVLKSNTSVAILTLYEGNVLVSSGKITLGFGSNSENVQYVFKLADSSNKTLFITNKSVKESLTVNLDSYPTAEKWNIYVTTANSTDSSLSLNEVICPQIEIGEVATEYLPYNGEKMTADKEGNVKGIVSVYPVTELTTDNPEVNIKCEYAKDINKFSGNGENVSVDQTYSAESENAQSGVALAPEFQKKIEFWKPNTFYKKGNSVIAIFYDEHESRAFYYVVGMECIKDHTSPELDCPNIAEDFNECWQYHNFESSYSYSAVTDGEYNDIISTYATKKELSNKQTAFAIYDEEDDGWGRLRVRATDFEMLVNPGAKMSIGDILYPIVIQEGSVNFNNSKLNGVTAPTADDDAATKKYVDDAVAAVSNGTTVGGAAGGSCEIDSVYDPTSENAQSGVGLSAVFQKKIEKWKPNTLYKEGDCVIAEWLYSTGTAMVVNVLLVCKAEHTSPDKTYPNQDATLNEVRKYWDFDYINSATAATAISDALGNSIHSTYATVASVENKYEKPSDGIPETDFEPALQQKLYGLFTAGKNKFDKNAVTRGKALNDSGVLYTTAGAITSDYCEVEPLTQYCLRYSSYVFAYNSNKEFVARLGNKQVITTPEDCAYIRFTMFSDLTETQQLEVGNVFTSYEEYSRTSINLANIPIRSIKTDKIKVPYLIVDKNGFGDYRTISDAVASVNSNDVLITIFVMPGEYDEAVKCGYKNVEIIGVDKYKCILYNTLGDYDNCPLYISSGCVKNMTVISRKDESKDYTGVSAGYAVHIDSYGHNKKLLIENCILHSDFNNTLGCGVCPGQTLEISNCYITGASDGFNIHGYGGTASMDIILNNNLLKSNGTDINFIGTPTDNKVNIMARFNIAKNVNISDPDTYILDESCFGNSNATLNKN